MSETRWSSVLGKADGFLILVGLLAGAALQLDRLAGLHQPPDLGLAALAGQVGLGALGAAAALLLIRWVLRGLVDQLPLPASVKARYPTRDIWPYGVFLLFALGAVGLRFPTPLLAMLVLAFLVLQLGVVYGLLDAGDKGRLFGSLEWLSFLFLVSGFAALIYQIVWQRALFTAFGVNIESVTIIVSVFMFGLGIGSLVGGILSRWYPARLPELFVACEVLTGLFGLVSLPLIQVASAATLHDSLLVVSLTTYALLCLPTILMGATLPLLVTYLHQYYRNIGKSVGLLYFINTMGSAIACFITADILFVVCGLQATVVVAAIGNFLVGFLVYRYAQRLAGERKPGSVTNPCAPLVDEAAQPSPLPPPRQGEKGQALRFGLVLVLSAVIGYISLSQEILWFRAVGYASGGRPDVFAHVLGFFLCGVACGALAAKWTCEREQDYTLPFTAAMLAASGVVYYLSMPICGQLMTISRPLGMVASYLGVGLIAFLTGGIFPALCHYGIRSQAAAGWALSWVYFANIVGSTAGPLLTGFVLLNLYPLEQNVVALSVATMAVAAVVWVGAALPGRQRTAILGAIVAVTAGMVLAQDGLYALVLEKLHYKENYAQKGPYRFLLQNRAGIVAVEAGSRDIIYGGGVYDGGFNLDPVLNTNGIQRAYMIAALHPHPQDVLEIGLSSGSWAQALLQHDRVGKMDIVEINPAYTQLIRHYPENAALLDDPRVQVHFDDGRRWLKRNPDARFDFILMNTFHWRSQATGLLSAEFLGECQHHLKPGGVVYYNTTLSEDVTFTAAQVFQHVVRYEKFIAASDSPFAMSPEERRQNLLRFHSGGKPVFDAGSPDRKRVLDQLVASDLSDQAEALRRRLDLWLITDDNMATEFKIQYQWFDSRARWTNLARHDK